jgi:ribosomal peptide maturation radical SAM protein 1
MPFPSVHLICMPYQNLALSSLSVALLATLLRSQGVATTESYLHFSFADLIGRETYARVAEGKLSDAFSGELLFAEDTWGRVDSEAELQRLEALFGDREARRRLAGAYRDVCLSRVAAVGADLVGLTTSFSQLVPALWLARQIKARSPEVKIVLGGAGCAAPMGQRLQAAYPEVDYVVSGEGEAPLLSLVRDPDAWRGPNTSEWPCTSLDELPVPDYDAFVSAWRQHGGSEARLMLAFESSRGCWWGERQHCTFCGLNQHQIAYRAKSSERVVAEIRDLWDRYHTALFATDSVMSTSHIRHVLPALAGYDSRPSIFYEIRAQLEEEDVIALKRAGVDWIQPGIESLSTPLLKLLRKGVTAIQNIALLKWCREQRIGVSWNVLCGIPGEDPEAYGSQIALMASIPHLIPPRGIVPIRIDRYSPYFESPEQHGIEGVRPYDAYRSLHPQMSSPELQDVAYHFEAVGSPVQTETYLDRLQKALTVWQERHSRGDGLFLDAEAGMVRIEGNEASFIHTDEAASAVIKRTHRIASLDRLLEETHCTSASLEALIDAGLLYREGNRIINLIVRVPQD